MNLPFFENPTDVAARLAPLGDVTLLDSGGSERGLWDIVAAAPVAELHLEADADSAAVTRFVEQLMHLEATLPDPGNTAARTLPFQGGLVGFLSYELGRRLQGLPPIQGGCEPLALVRLYPWAVVQNRRLRTSALVSWLKPSALPGSHILEALRGPAPDSEDFVLQRGVFEASWSYSEYAQRFAHVMEYIAAGDCYQINLGQPFLAAYQGSLETAYRRLRNVARAPFSALFPLDTQHTLLSFSPERFLCVNGRRVETYPIKGTRPRDADPRRDTQLAAELLASPKERAENLMIVDLLRNDIGRFCTTGSIKADALFELESYATVHHLVSRVSGELRDGVSPLELLLGCLPGGSITGAPKHRAMQLIDELEAQPRQSWCGTLFLRSACGRLDSNILIRTLLGDGSTLTCWAGGGLVADSQPEDEYRELEHKIGALLRALSTSP